MFAPYFFRLLKPGNEPHLRVRLVGLVQDLIKDKPITALSVRSNLPIEYAKDKLPQSGTTVDLQNSYNPILKGNSIDSIDINMQKDMLIAEKEMNILQSKIAEQLQQEQIFQSQKGEAQRNYDSIHQLIQSVDLAKRESDERCTISKKALGSVQNHMFNPTNTLKIAQEKLSFLKSKEHIYKQQRVSGFLEFFTIN